MALLWNPWPVAVQWSTSLLLICVQIISVCSSWSIVGPFFCWSEFHTWLWLVDIGVLGEQKVDPTALKFACSWNSSSMCPCRWAHVKECNGGRDLLHRSSHFKKIFFYVKSRAASFEVAGSLSFLIRWKCTEKIVLPTVAEALQTFQPHPSPVWINPVLDIKRYIFSLFPLTTKLTITTQLNLRIKKEECPVPPDLLGGRVRHTVGKEDPIVSQNTLRFLALTHQLSNVCHIV